MFMTQVQEIIIFKRKRLYKLKILTQLKEDQNIQNWHNKLNSLKYKLKKFRNIRMENETVSKSFIIFLLIILLNYYIKQYIS
jgi:hypothetical protein